jgi:hypothetical protein
MQTLLEEIDAGDIVLTPSKKIGIVVGIYGAGYYEVLMNKDTQNPRVLPFRRTDLKRLPAGVATDTNEHDERA